MSGSPAAAGQNATRRAARRVLDISVPVSTDTPVWPGDTPFSCLWTWSMQDGASVNVSAATWSPHVGTHADTPLHVSAAAPGSESLDVSNFVGDATVVDVTDLRGSVALEQLERRLGSGPVTRVLLRTGRGIASGSFPDSWPVLDVHCVRELMRRGLRLLGVDCPSVDDRDSRTLAVHHALLDHGAAVLENLDLRAAPAGRYLLIALPLRVSGLDAAPVRALLTAR